MENDNIQQPIKGTDIFTETLDENEKQQGQAPKQNKKLWIIASIITGIIIAIGVLFFAFFTSTLNNNEKQLVAENAHMNYAWGFFYGGKAIFSDGTIYEWELSGDYDNDGYENFKTREGRKNWILKHGTLVNKTVTEQDMDKIKKGIYALKDTTYEKKNYMFDAGSSYVSIWRNDEEMIILKESGDWQGENQTKEAQDLINIINKYTSE